jgi:hypothetical protein
MRIPTIQGIIDRRMLVNFIADPEVVQKILPQPFKPKVYNGKSIVGICLIRLKHVRPKGFPDFIGINSENAAHRIAVEWKENEKTLEGVYIPRRDTSSLLNHFGGGRIFPGKHFHAKFDVEEKNGSYHIAFNSSDDTSISIDANVSNELDSNSIFKDLESASEFFRKGSVGYSPNGNNYDGLKLTAFSWEVKPLKVSQVYSSFFDNEKIFPKSSVQFDNALLMTNIKHEWESVHTKLDCECIAHQNS